MKRTSLLIACLLFVLLGGAIYFGNANAMSGESKIIFESGKTGVVEFNHYSHLQTLPCSSCHHIEENAKIEPAQPCRDCHGVMQEAPTMKKVSHSLCKGCHKKLERGPKKCKECHSK
jgi:hypothetical protein